VRERRAYRLAVAGGVAGTVGVVGLALAVVGVIGATLPILALVLAAICAFLFRRLVSR
jgi:multisubunit Na+/H+ antiporter MnhG subunit